MGKIKEIIAACTEQKWTCFFLFLIIFVGVFLRTYQYSQWMHFELDQARDVLIVYDALMDGTENFPLVGPQARGRELYLGPIFYYFQIASGALFGVSPESAALPDLLFSIVSILLFYFFTRLFFRRYMSLWLTALFATSLYLVIYGRFAWNPNAMVFWSLVTFYGLLRAWDGKQFHARWFLVAVVGLAVVTQLHFIAFLTAPLIFLAYVAIVRMRVSWRVIVASVMVALFLYMPVVIYDVQSNGKNIRTLIASVTMSPDADAAANTASDREHDVVEQTFRALQESATFYWHALSADDHGRYHIRTKKSEQGYFPLICDKKCVQALPYHIIALVVFIGSLLIFAWIFFNTWKRAHAAQHEKLTQRRNRELLIFLWLLFSGIFFVLVAYQISPRFFLFVIVPFHVIFGMTLEKIFSHLRWEKIVVGAIFILLIGVNVWMTVHYFSVLSRSERGIVEWRDIAMSRSDFITLGQLRLASTYVSNNMHSPFVIVGDNRYARALYYLNAFEDDNNDVQCYVKRGGFDPATLDGVPYALLVKTGSQEHINDDMRVYHMVKSKKAFGTVTIYTLVPRQETLFIPEEIGGCFVR